MADETPEFGALFGAIWLQTVVRTGLGYICVAYSPVPRSRDCVRSLAKQR